MGPARGREEGHGEVPTRRLPLLFINNNWGDASQGLSSLVKNTEILFLFFLFFLFLYLFMYRSGRCCLLCDCK